ncbi:hypothetical protein [Pseudodesulfovibrio sp. zrk46]|uniref:hypothetical protein n=1 Tax=Pseudodesulfovibrio sp. zrk46 TaxID=2725288 RepID=UPI0014497190|nr:hypothetical protein [Pseudodesulfovibrio sp. zrk46]QJB55353.1 hypothetical protein HFN16_02630 [Pseudodesulfovibrio sp. zrk46]
MSDEGLRIEFGDKGPYLFQVLDTEPEAMLLEEHGICLLQFGKLYLPVNLSACNAMSNGLSNMNGAEMGPEREGMIPVEFDLEESTELPVVTGGASDASQFGDMIYYDVQFGDTDARLCFSGRTAAAVVDILSQIPAE